MELLLIIIAAIILFGGGGYWYTNRGVSASNVGAYSIGGLLVTILIIYLFVHLIFRLV